MIGFGFRERRCGVVNINLRCFQFYEKMMSRLEQTMQEDQHEIMSSIIIF